MTTTKPCEHPEFAQCVEGGPIICTHCNKSLFAAYADLRDALDATRAALEVARVVSPARMAELEAQLTAATQRANELERERDEQVRWTSDYLFRLNLERSGEDPVSGEDHPATMHRYRSERDAARREAEQWRVDGVAVLADHQRLRARAGTWATCSEMGCGECIGCIVDAAMGGANG